MRFTSKEKASFVSEKRHTSETAKGSGHFLSVCFAFVLVSASISTGKARFSDRQRYNTERYRITYGTRTLFCRTFTVRWPYLLVTYNQSSQKSSL